MRAEYSNGFPVIDLDHFAMVVKLANDNLTLNKLSSYGIKEENVERRTQELAAVLGNAISTERMKHVNQQNGENTLNGQNVEKIRPALQKNPFKQKLKMQLRLLE